MPHRHIKFIQYQLGRDTFSFFCDSGEQLEILNFLLHIQDLGHTVCRMKKPGSPKRCLSVPLHNACHNARASGTGPSAATALKQENLEFLTVRRRNRKRKKCLFPASGYSYFLCRSHTSQYIRLQQFNF